MSSPKPTILLVHGAWHSPATFRLIIPKLEALSFPVITLLSPTSAGEKPNATHLDDIAAIHEVVIPLMDEGKEIVIVAHSYGGIPGCACTKGQTVPERSARGEKGGFRSILFLAAYAIPRRGMSAAETYGRLVEWNQLEGPNGEFSVPQRGVIPYFYYDLPVSEQEYWYSQLTKQTMASMLTPVDFIPSDLTIPSTYLVCENDHMMYLELQETMLAASPKTRSVRCGEGHFPFLSNPDLTVGIIVEAAGL